VSDQKRTCPVCHRPVRWAGQEVEPDGTKAMVYLHEEDATVHRVGIQGK
jgi:hypothetical protein